MSELLNMIRREAERVAGQGATTRLGVVTSYDPKRYVAKVRIEPEGHETGWLPIGTPWVGDGWGLVAPPSPGDQVQVEYQEGNYDTGLVVLRFFSDQVKPPKEVPSGEFVIFHESGSYIELRNDGTVRIHSPQGIRITSGQNIESQANTWQHTGNLEVSGQVSDQNGTMQEMRTIYNSHTGHSTGGPPSPQMT